jgi:hypothetical protein
MSQDGKVLGTFCRVPGGIFPRQSGCLGSQKRIEKRLLKLCRTIGAHQPDVLSNQLLMLIEGAYSTAGILGKRDAVKATAKAAEALIDAAIA